MRPSFIAGKPPWRLIRRMAGKSPWRSTCSAGDFWRLTALLKDIRFEQRVFDPQSRRWCCAMSAAVRNITGQLVTAHRTLLSPNGTKADADSPKRLMKLPEGRTVNGCAVRFGEPHDVLALPLRQAASGVDADLNRVSGRGFFFLRLETPFFQSMQ